MSRLEKSPFIESGLEHCLAEVARKGIAYRDNFLDRIVVEEIQRLCASLDFKEIEEQHERVTERYFVPTYIPSRVGIAVAELGASLRNTVQKYSSMYPVFNEWDPSDFSIQLYNPDSYITSHREHKKHQGLIVVFTLQGEALCEARHERHGEPFMRFHLKEGGGLFLRGTGLNTELEGHPGIFHTISGAITKIPRIALGFRDKN